MELLDGSDLLDLQVVFYWPSPLPLYWLDGPLSALMGTLCILAGQVLILALGLLWQRSIVPIAEPVWETLARLGPGLLMKTAFGGLVVVTLSRIIERNSKETPTIES